MDINDKKPESNFVPYCLAVLCLFIIFGTQIALVIYILWKGQ